MCKGRIQSLRRAKNFLLSVVPNKLLLGVLCEDVEVEMEEETEKEAEVDAEEGLKEEVESGLDERNVLRAGLEIEAVARSVPDLTEPELNLEEENRDGRRGDSVDVVASPRILKPDVRTLFCVAAWKSSASSASFALSNSSSQVQPFFLALANFGAQVSSTMIPVFPSCPGLFPPVPSRTAMHFLTLLQASPQFLGSLLANAVGTMRTTTRRRLASCIFL